MVEIKVIDCGIGDEKPNVFTYNSLSEMLAEWFGGNNVPANDAEVLGFVCEGYEFWNTEFFIESDTKSFGNLMEFVQKRLGFIMIENLVKAFIGNHERDSLVLWYGDNHMGLSKKNGTLLAPFVSATFGEAFVLANQYGIELVN